MVKKSRKQLLQSRIREMKRLLLHTNDEILQTTYKTHIDFLEVEIALINTKENINS